MLHLILAQVAQAAPPPSPTMTDAMGNLVTLGLLFAGMYFLVIAPQRQKEKELQKLLKELQKGDKVVTTGGMIGVISTLSDETIDLVVADKVTVTFQRAAVQGKFTEASTDSKPETKSESKTEASQKKSQK